RAVACIRVGIVEAAHAAACADRKEPLEEPALAAARAAPGKAGLDRVHRWPVGAVCVLVRFGHLLSIGPAGKRKSGRVAAAASKSASKAQWPSAMTAPNDPQT